MQFILTGNRKTEVGWTFGRHNVITELYVAWQSLLDHCFDFLGMSSIWILPIFVFFVITVGVLGRKQLWGTHIAAGRAGVSDPEGRATPAGRADLERSSRADWRDERRRLCDLVDSEARCGTAAISVVVVVDGDVEESVADDEAVLTGGRRPRPGDQNTRGVDCSTMNLKRCRAGSWQWQPTDKKPLLVRWLCYVVVSCSGNGFGCINEVTRRRARLVLGRVTVFGRACNQPLRPTQPPTLSGTRNEYRPKCGNALRLEVKPRWMAHSRINV